MTDAQILALVQQVALLLVLGPLVALFIYDAIYFVCRLFGLGGAR